MADYWVNVEKTKSSLYSSWRIECMLVVDWLHPDKTNRVENNCIEKVL